MGFFTLKKVFVVVSKPRRRKRMKLDPEKREAARVLVHKRLEYFNGFYGFHYHKVFIKNQRTRWGSCSKAGNLNFNHKIADLPQELCDYVIVHELCHLKELNHSKRFWELLSQTFPNYKDLRASLKRIATG